MFKVAPIPVMYFHPDGSVQMIADAEPEDGFRSMSEMPKNVIQKPGIDPAFFPKNNHRDFKPIIKATSDGIPSIEDVYPNLFYEPDTQW